VTESVSEANQAAAESTEARGEKSDAAPAEDGTPALAPEQKEVTAEQQSSQTESTESASDNSENSEKTESGEESNQN